MDEQEAASNSCLLDAQAVQIMMKNLPVTIPVVTDMDTVFQNTVESTTIQNELPHGLGRSLSVPEMSEIVGTTSDQTQINLVASGSVGIMDSASTSYVNVSSAQNPSMSISEESSKIVAADSNSCKQSMIPCKVCGDRASGYHYGVTSCEGCKGFFRRSIQKQIEYRCLRDGKCTVIRLNRNRCQYCRFKKCLAVGMSRDSVRYGRVPKRSKSQDHDQRVTSTDSTQEQSALENKQLAIYDVILSISQAHHAHCAVTEDKMKTFNRKTSTLVEKIDLPEGSLQFTDEQMESQRLSMWNQLAKLITPSIHSVVEFAKRVPSFSELSQDDQLILIKAGFFEVWLTRMSRMFNRGENLVTFEDGSMIHRDELSVVFSPSFVSSLFDVAASFNHLNLNDTEVGLFTGIVLATADRPGLANAKGVEQIQDKLIEALKLQVSRNHSTEDNLFASIIMKFPELRTLGHQHNELLKWYRIQWSRVNLPPLFAEIYDIPKQDDLLQVGTT